MAMIRTDDPLYNYHVWFNDQKYAQSIDWAYTFDRFQKTLWDFYKAHKRDFDWRSTSDPYAIVVSELMLQQTQTNRVKEKYVEFLQAFPTFASLAQAPVQDVLKIWVGLGYNRRAFSLQSIAQKVVNDYQNRLPDEPAILETFKGIGPATAGSITAFAYNKPTIFIETNIRAVYLHTFFQDQKDIPDTMLEPLVRATVDSINPREWYYALMDYGVIIKKLYPNPSRKSKHHSAQSAFEGSNRQVRGAIVKLIADKGSCSFDEVYMMFSYELKRIQ